MKIAVVGAGIIGRLAALRLYRSGHDVSLYDRGDWNSRTACSFAAAGLLAPFAEAAGGERDIAELGLASLALWDELFSTLGKSVTMRRQGTLAVARDPDIADLIELKDKIATRLPAARLAWLDAGDLAELEPDLAVGGFTSALLLPDEGYVQSREVLAALAATLAHSGVICHLGKEVERLASGLVSSTDSRGNDKRSYDLVIDCRGLGARGDLPELRGVRGEIVEIHAPEVALTRPVRVLHQRYPVYIVPRGDHHYAVGATCIESESSDPVTVKSALELLSAAYGAHPGFRYAKIIEMNARCRPAFPDNLPRIQEQPGLWRVNGLYRHGFLLAPLVVDALVRKVDGGVLPPEEKRLWTEVIPCD